MKTLVEARMFSDTEAIILAGAILGAAAAQSRLGGAHIKRRTRER